MSAYLPNSHISDVFLDRGRTGGIYDTAFLILDDSKFLSLGRADNGSDFNRKPLDSWSGSYTFLDSNRKDLVLYAFGEILGSDYGTCVGALGNHFVGASSSPNLLTDSCKPKHLFALGKPTGCTKKLGVEWYNQLATIETLVYMEKEIDANSGKEYQVKPPVKACEIGQSNDILVVVSGPIYQVPKQLHATAKYRTKKRHYQEIDEGTVAKEAPRYRDENEGTGPLPDQALPKDDCVKLHARYDRRVFRDYGGPIFAQRTAQALQQDFRGVEGDLIPPWKYFDVLRPGTFILLALQPTVWVTKDRSGTYHLIVKSLRVLALSDAAAEEPIVFRKDDEEAPKQQDDLLMALRSLQLPVFSDKKVDHGRSSLSPLSPSVDTDVAMDDLEQVGAGQGKAENRQPRKKIRK
ncbi:hypothetical protein VNI00_018664 [Paramarasmius palmivorus]|uniref:Uncharacterized protein n=1 Tax=Paramarasmius palmivorus TaxID=297713 RepID=A0AAW0AV87_9AGAR